MAYASVAHTAILPLQDVLGLDETARMNLPASSKANWLWRLKPGQLLPAYKNQLMKWARLYNRIQG
jgi:4-alpha-glucanotransferase